MIILGTVSIGCLLIYAREVMREEKESEIPDFVKEEMVELMNEIAEEKEDEPSQLRYEDILEENLPVLRMRSPVLRKRGHEENNNL